jgi:hypothetical protein
MAATLTILMSVEPAESVIDADAIEQKLKDFAAAEDWELLSLGVRVVVTLIASG